MPDKKPQFQYTLHLLLLLMVMVSVGFASVRISRSNRTMEAWTRINQNTTGGHTSELRFQVSSPSELKMFSRIEKKRVKELRILNAEELTDGDFERLSTFGNLRTLYLQYGNVIQRLPTGLQHSPSLEELHVSLADLHIHHEVLSQIGSIDALSSLDLTGTNVTDEDVIRILQTAKLTGLRLGMTGVTDETVKRIPELAPSLRSLELTETKVTGASLRFIAQLTSLEELHLARLNLSDRDVKQLVTLQKLKWLSIPRDRISGDTLELLKNRLPQCAINE